MIRPLIVIVSFFALAILNCVDAQTIEVSLDGEISVRGKPIYWDQHSVVFLERDGRLVTFSPADAKKFRKLSDRFSSLSQAELRGKLMREFGSAFEVSGTGQYLVVHPAGQRDRWAGRFEQLYRRVVHYFRARGFSTNRPEFPFIAIVLPSQESYEKYLRRQKVDLGFNSLGYYDLASNRIHLYDVTEGRTDSSDWQINAGTIIHEAVHQTAHNIGIHQRDGDEPLWLVEGIGTLFEAAGVWDSRQHQTLHDRVNQRQLENYRRLVDSTSSLGLLKQQIATDDLFSRKTNLAYAHAWAMTFFLTEQEPRRFAELIQQLNRRQAFGRYTAKERIADFQKVFGSDLQMFDARMQRFLETL